MDTRFLADTLIYLDANFVSLLYENEKKIAVRTVISRSQTLEASASLAVFSGGGITTESRSFEISSIQMLEQLQHRLNAYPTLRPEKIAMGTPSTTIWLNGTLSVSKIKVTRTKSTIALAGKPPESQKTQELIGEEAYFCVKSGEHKFALSPNDEFFAPGVAAFKGMAHLVIDRLALPCKALVRVFSGQTNAKEWLSTPLVIYDATPSTPISH